MNKSEGFGNEVLGAMMISNGAVCSPVSKLNKMPKPPITRCYCCHEAIIN